MLVDPANFHAWETDRVRIVKGCFTTELAQQFRRQQQQREEEKADEEQQAQVKEQVKEGEQKQRPPAGGGGAAGDLLFVSDIRSTQPGMSSEEFEERVNLDMKVGRVGGQSSNWG